MFELAREIRKEKEKKGTWIRKGRSQINAICR
jgi:hypothetical protein